MQVPNASIEAFSFLSGAWLKPLPGVGFIRPRGAWKTLDLDQLRCRCGA